MMRSKTSEIRIIATLVFCIPFFQIVIAQSTDLDKQLGAENAKMVAEQMGIYDDDELTKYVRDIGNRLVSKLDNRQFDFQFHVVDDPTPNAFALPGGYVYVTRGILSLITTEDELAGVMAHEIIHVERRHSVKQMKKSIIPKLFELPGQVVGAVVSEDLGNLLNAPIETSNKLFLSNYSRKHETESDVKGVALAAKAGYDPSQLSIILDRLSKAVEMLTEQEEKKSYFDDHPYTPDRVRTIKKTVRDLRWTAAPAIAPDFPEPLDGMLFGHNPGHGVFKDNVFLHPEMSFVIEFPEGWETSNQPTTVGAVHPDRQAGVFIGMDDPSRSSEDLGTEFAQRLKREYPGTPIDAKSYKLNGTNGFLVNLVDTSGSESMYIHVLWVRMGEHMFKLIGLGPMRYESQLKSTAESLHIMTSAERRSISKTEFKVVPAQGRTIGEIQNGLESPVSPDINAFLNGTDANAKQPSGSRVKILIERAY